MTAIKIIGCTMILLTVLMFIIIPWTLAGEVILSWDANSDSIAGYKIYKSRTGKRPFTYAATAGAAVTSITLQNISTALPHVFAVTAFNNMSAESGYSNRAHISVPYSRSTASVTGSVKGGF